MTIYGLDVLEKSGWRALEGMKLGLVTNHTGLNIRGETTIDLLRAVTNCELKSLFSPEHGIRGAVDEEVLDSFDSRSGLSIFSLYGARTRPTPEQLEGLDALVYDIQDIGCRFYTYISTLGHCLEAAAEAGLKFIVLDRPNPIGGTAIEGPNADEDALDFVGFHSIPIRHGLTVAEIAKLLVREKKLDVDLETIPAEGWRRRELWDATGLVWTNPSPNMRSLTQGLLYPGVGLLEFTNVSVGRGTDTPFEIVGAPWIRARELAFALNGVGLPGISFVPVRFAPNASKFAGEMCEGVNLVLTNRADFIPVLTGLKVAETLLKVFPEDWESEKYARLLHHKQSFQALLQGATAEEIVASWKGDIARFEERKAEIELYV